MKRAPAVRAGVGAPHKVTQRHRGAEHSHFGVHIYRTGSRALKRHLYLRARSISHDSQQVKLPKCPLMDRQFKNVVHT